jgi:acid phosphatase
MLAALSAVLTGCQTPNTSGNTLRQCRPLVATAASRSPAWSGSVFTIVMENHSRSEIIGNPDAPYINALASENAVAAGYHDPYVHPSEPNYLWMVAGENFGILDDDDPSAKNTISSRSHLADQIERAGLSWKTYQESMGDSCGLRTRGKYAVKHDPFAYFSDINGWDGRTFQRSERCDAHIVGYSRLDADLKAGTVPDYVFITPNLADDMHDGSIAAGDRWLGREVPKILASDAYERGGVLFLLWDEGGDHGDDPPFIAVSPHAKHGFVSHTEYDTSSYLKTVQAVLGVEALPCSEQSEATPSMDDLFETPLPASIP